ncbi:MAG: hypothetical protein RJB06_398 [Pseudomonadota bacterium]
MMRCIQFIQTYSGNLSTSFNSSELLAVQALCHQLGSQNALLVQIAWLQISSFAQYSGHEFRWTSLLWISSKTINSKHLEHRVYPPIAHATSA